MGRILSDFIEERTPVRTFLRKAKCKLIGAAPERWVIQKHIKGFAVNIGAGRDRIKGTITLDNLQHRSYTDWEVVPDIEADACNMPFADESVDTLIAMHVWEHIIDPNRFLREAWRVLKPGGKLCLVLPNGDYLSDVVYWRDPTHQWLATPDKVLLLIAGWGLVQWNRLKYWCYPWSFDVVLQKWFQ